MHAPHSLARRALLAAGGIATIGIGTLVASPALADTTTPAGAAPAAVSGTCTDGTRIRATPVNGAVRGTCYHTHKLTLRCYVWASDGHSWDRLTDNTTGVSGYAQDQLLHENGSINQC